MPCKKKFVVEEKNEILYYGKYKNQGANFWSFIQWTVYMQ